MSPRPEYIYYRIYAEDGAVPSQTPGNPFVGRIKVQSVAPPRTAKNVKRSIAKMENIKDLERTSLFLSPFSQSPLDDTDKVTIHDLTDPGSTPKEPLAFVAKMSDFVGRSSVERGGLASAQAAAAESDTEGVRYVYYMLYAVDGDQIPSKVATDTEKPFLGRIRADYITPPHSLSSLKLYLSRVERSPTLAYAANLFEDETPLEEISNLRTDGPGMSPDEPMAIVLKPTIPGPDGRYFIKNRAAEIYWTPYNNPITTVYFYTTTMEGAREYNSMQWDIKHDTNGNISMTSPFAPSSWVGANVTGSTVPVPWRLIPADGKFYYLTTEINLDSQNPQVPEALGQGYGTMATLKKGDRRQMWEFIPV